MGGTSTAKKLTTGVPSSVQTAIVAARAEIADLAGQITQRRERIAQLQAFIDSCQVFEDRTTAGVGTYAEHATSLLAAARRPMRSGELLDAMAAAGRPVRGLTRKHRQSTLAISLKRAPSLLRTPKGWWLHGVPMPSGNANAS